MTPEITPDPGAAGQPASRADFAVVRVPLLAVDTLADWAKGTRACAAVSGSDAELAEALATDRAMLRARLSALLDDQQISGSLAVASPDLAWGIRRWRADPGARKAASAERSLVRYLTRMASRPSPFGLASSYIVGDVTGQPALEVESRHQIQLVARIDVGLLRTIVRDAVAKALDSDDLLLRRNPGVYRAAGRLRVAAQARGSNKHRLLAIRPTPAIEAVLEAAHPQARTGELTAVIRQSGASPGAARALLARLLRNELLIPAAQVTATGEEPTAATIAVLRSVPGGEHAAEVLGRAARALKAVGGDATGMADAVAGHVTSLGIGVSRRRCVQVDSIRTGRIVLPPAVLGEMRRAIDLLAQITPERPDPLLPSFCERFRRRFGTRAVPLLEALDPDSGVALDESAAHVHDGARAGARQATLLALIERGRRSPQCEVELTQPELAALGRVSPASLPAAFACTFKLTGRDAGSIAAGEFTLVEPMVAGPSGARRLGRLCHGDEELERRVRGHLVREAALAPDAVLAEVCTAPDTDWGLNVTHRPVLRDWEIECGGYSGAPPGQRLEPADLLVAVVGGEVVLDSATLGRRVLVRSTTALNPAMLSLPAARFLALLARQELPGGLGWDWGDLADAPVLPRVRHGRTVLGLRRWTMSAAELSGLKAGTDAAGFRRLEQWLRAHELPRFVHATHGTRPLLIDFANVLSVDAFIAALQGVDRIKFTEAPEVESSPVAGPDGRYAHEFIVPCTRISLPAPALPEARPFAAPAPESRRRFEPGSEWLYANLYGPKSAADDLLTGTIAPLRDQLRQAKLIDRWFFIRYADPDRHLRIRFHGRPDELLRDVLPALHEAIVPAFHRGVVYRTSLDTYEREVERYGGLEGVALMEAAAEADSDAVLEILRHAMTSAERRWLAVASLAALYADSGLGLEVRQQCCASLRQKQSRGYQGSLEMLLGEGARRERSGVEATVASLDAADPSPAAQALRARSPRLRAVFAQLTAVQDADRLHRSVADVLGALAHMSVNRLLRESGGLDELRVHDALGRLYASQLARARSGARVRA